MTPAAKDPLWVKLMMVALSVFVGLLLCEAAIRLVAGAPLAERLPVLEVRANPHRGGVLVILKTTYNESIKSLSPAFLMREEAFRALFDERKVHRIEFFGKLIESHTCWTEDVYSISSRT